MTAPFNPEPFQVPVDSTLSPEAIRDLDSRIAYVSSFARGVFQETGTGSFFDRASELTSTAVAAEAEVLAIAALTGTSGDSNTRASLRSIKEGVMMGHLFAEKLLPHRHSLALRQRQGRILRMQGEALMSGLAPSFADLITTQPTAFEQKIRREFPPTIFEPYPDSKDEDERQAFISFLAWAGSIGIVHAIELQIHNKKLSDTYGMRRDIISARITRFLPLSPPEA